MKELKKVEEENLGRDDDENRLRKLIEINFEQISIVFVYFLEWNLNIDG